MTQFPAQNRSIPVSVYDKVTEAPKSIAARLDFSVDTVWSVDYNTLRQQTDFQSIRTLYYDLEDCDNDIQIQIRGTTQRLILRAGKQGYTPLLVADHDMVVEITGTAPDIARLIFLNVDVPPAEWPQDGGQSLTAGTGIDITGDVIAVDGFLVDWLTEDPADYATVADLAGYVEVAGDTMTGPLTLTNGQGVYLSTGTPTSRIWDATATIFNCRDSRLFVREELPATTDLMVVQSFVNGGTRLRGVAPLLDNNYSCGLSALRWSVVYAATGTINTSDATEKTEFNKVPDAVKHAVLDVMKNQYGLFQWIASINEKGDEARRHAGVTAQSVRDAFLKRGISPDGYGLFCADALEDGAIRYGLRYEQFYGLALHSMLDPPTARDEHIFGQEASDWTSEALGRIETQARQRLAKIREARQAEAERLAALRAEAAKQAADKAKEKGRGQNG